MVVAVEKILDVNADTRVVYPSMTAVRILNAQVSYLLTDSAYRRTFFSLANSARGGDHLVHRIPPRIHLGLVVVQDMAFPIPSLAEASCSLDSSLSGFDPRCRLAVTLLFECD